MDIVLATSNKGKVRELQKILKNHTVYTMGEAGFSEEIEENGSSFEENAMIKAEAVCKALGKVAVADDSGLEVYALDMRPGIYSARYAGEGAGDEERNRKLLSELAETEDRRARFVSAAAICTPKGEKYVCRGEVYGNINYAPKGENGFGYDPLFVPDGFEKTMSEISNDEKNEISHRARAFEKLKEYIEKMGM